MSMLMGMIGNAGMGALGTLYVKLTADSTSLIRGMAQAETAIGGGTARMLKQLTILSMGVAGAMSAIGAVAVREAMKFESSFAGVRKTVEATEEEFKALENTFRSMAKQLPINVNEINKIAEAAGQLGIKKQNLEGFTKTIIDLGNTTNLFGDEAAKSMARFANITQMSQKDFSRLGSTIVALGNNSATTEAEIMGMAMRLAGAGTTIGLAEHEVVSLAAALSSVGIEAEAGGTAISQFMIKTAKAVSTGSEELEIFAGVAGMTARQFSEAFEKDAAGALLKVMEGLGAMAKSGEDVFTLLDQLGMDGIRLTDVMLRASGAGDLFSRSLKLGSKAWEENSALAKEAEQRYKTFESQLHITINLIRDLFLTIGDGLMPAMRQMNKELQDLLSTNDSFNESLKKDAEAIGDGLLYVLKFIKTVYSGWMGLMRFISWSALAAAEAILKAFQTIQPIILEIIEDILATFTHGINEITSYLNKLVLTVPGFSKITGINLMPGMDLTLGLKPTDVTRALDTVRLAKEEMWSQLVNMYSDGTKEMGNSVKEAELPLKSFRWGTEMVKENLKSAAGSTREIKSNSVAVSAMLEKMGPLPETGLGGIPGFGDQGTMTGAQMAKDLKYAEDSLEVLRSIGDEEVNLTQEVQRKKLEAIAAFSEQAKLLQVAQAQFALATASGMFGDLAAISAAFAGEQSGIFKSMFAASKAFAIAESAVKIQQGIANAASLPFPANLAAMASVISATASIVSNIQAVKLAFDGKRAAGGSVVGGGAYLVGERGTEVFSPSENGTIIPNHQLGGGPIRVVVNNYTDARPEVTEREENGERVIEVMIRRVKNEIGSEIRDGRGSVTKAMESSFGLRRGRV